MDTGGVLLNPQDPSAETISGEGVAWGMVYVTRPAFFAGACWSPATGYQPDYLVSGQQTVTVELVAPVDTLRVHLGLQPNMILPSGIPATAVPPLLNGQPWPDSMVISVWVDSAGQFLPNKTVSLSLQAVDSAGLAGDSLFGHMHFGMNGARKPAGSISSTVTTGTNGFASVVFHAPGVSGPVVIRAASPGADSALATVQVGVAGLQALVQRQSDTLIGQTTPHPNNHYGIPAMVTRLEALADSFYARYRRRLYFNDMSLSFGGVFDTASNWIRPHGEHKTGRDADLRTVAVNDSGGLSRLQRIFAQDVWEHSGGSVYPETTHFHLRYRGRE